MTRPLTFPDQMSVSRWFFVKKVSFFVKRGSKVLELRRGFEIFMVWGDFFQFWDPISSRSSGEMEILIRFFRNRQKTWSGFDFSMYESSETSLVHRGPQFAWWSLFLGVHFELDPLRDGSDMVLTGLGQDFDRSTPGFSKSSSKFENFGTPFDMIWPGPEVDPRGFHKVSSKFEKTGPPFDMFWHEMGRPGVVFWSDFVLILCQIWSEIRVAGCQFMSKPCLKSHNG